MERFFINSRDLPKVGSFLHIENLQYMESTQVKYSDVTFDTFPHPVQPLDSEHFVYHWFRFSVRSQFKLATATAHPDCQQLKTLLAEKEFKKDVETKLKSILSQGTNTAASD